MLVVLQCSTFAITVQPIHILSVRKEVVRYYG